MDRDALNYIIRSIRNDPEGVWDTDYLHSCYLNKGGQILISLGLQID